MSRTLAQALKEADEAMKFRLEAEEITQQSLSHGDLAVSAAYEKYTRWVRIVESTIQTQLAAQRPWEYDTSVAYAQAALEQAHDALIEAQRKVK